MKNTFVKVNISFFLINHNSVGGVERVTSNLIKIFEKNNLKIRYIFSLGDISVKNKIIKLPNYIELVQVSRNNLSAELHNHIIDNCISHLIFQGDNMTFSKDILRGVKNTNCKSFLHYHGSPYAYLKKNIYWYDIKENPINIFKKGIARIFLPFKKAKLMKNIKNSDGFITVSNAVKQELLDIYNIEFDNITCIHNPTSFKVNGNIIFKKEKKIILISRLVRKHKNVLLALRVWKRLHIKYPDWKLQILGGGLLLPKLEKYIIINNLKNIDLVGHVNNVDEYLKKSSISISTSDTEGFSMTTYEAIAFKNPIIATKSYGGIYDLIVDKENGLFSPKDDDKKMAKNLELLINNEKLRTQMGNDSYQKYITLQNENIFSQWSELLRI